MEQTVTESPIAATDAQWREYVELIAPLGERAAEMFPNEMEDPQLRDEMLRFVYSYLGSGYMQLAFGNSQHPDLFPCWSQLFNNLGMINPDGVYYLSPIDDDGVYRLSGFRNTLRLVDVQLGDSAVFARGAMREDETFGPTLGNFELDDLTLDSDGAFDVVISAERPDGHEGDWQELPAGTDYLLVRQFAYDWVNELDARIAIERLDTPAAKPRQSIEEIREALERIPEFGETHLKTLAVAVFDEKGLANPALINNVTLIDYTPDQGGRVQQLYICGRFEIESDEALIVELAPGECKYWNLHLCNPLTNTLDFVNRLTATNGGMAEADAEGAYRIVISEGDPGVPNWLDTMGHDRGFIWGRMDGAENDDPPAIKKVKLSEVRHHFPDDTPEVTPDQRDAEIRRRRRGAQLRRRW